MAKSNWFAGNELTAADIIMSFPLEAFRSRKPVLTCMDSGGPAELVSVGRSGYVLLPEPFQIAQQLDVWASSPDLAARMGSHGAEDTDGVRWDACVDKLLEDPAAV